jgi:hypothetical protein
MNARLSLLTLFIYSSIAMVIFIAMKNSSDDRVLASVFPREITLDEVIFFSDSTPHAESHVWDFGSMNNKSLKAKGTYKYQKPGPYIIRLSINNKVVDSFPVLVKAPPEGPRKKNTVTIYAAAEAIVGQSVHFQILGPKDIETIDWYFGETGKVGSHDAEAFHTYYNKGTYDVKLITNLSTEPLYHTIEIKEGYKINKTTIPTEPAKGGGDTPPEEIKQYLQKIADGGFTPNYNYILSHFLCNNTHVAVTTNGRGGNDFYSYCQNLQLNSGTKIDNVATEPDPKSGCINKLIITQH